MTIGSLQARPKKHPDDQNRRGIFERILSVFLAAVLVSSLVPNVAWADGEALTPSIAESSAPDAASSSSSAEGEAGGVALSSGDAISPLSSLQGSADVQAETSPTNLSDATTGNTVAEGSLTDQAFAADQGEAAALSSVDSAVAPADDSYVFVQDAQDKDGTSKISGSLEVGAVLWANLHDYDSDDAIPHDDAWSYQWMFGMRQSSSITDYVPIEGQTSQSLTLTEDLADQLAGSYLVAKIEVAGKDYYGPGYWGITSSSVPGPVMKAGAVQLSGVELGKPATTELGTALEAKAYTGSSYSPTYVTDGVTYTWKYAETTSPSYSTTWTTIEGVTGTTFTVSDPFYVGKCLSVSANAGANTVDFGYPYGYGPFKLAGAVDIYSASLNTYAVAVGDTITAQAKEKGSTSGIDSSKLTYQWQVSTTSKTGAFSDIPAATSSNFTLDSSYQGSYIRCLIKAKVGSSSYSTTATNAVAAAGSINVTSVSLDKSGKVTEGDVVAATAKASSQDVTSSDGVSWSWYSGDTASTVVTPIEGVTGSSLEVTSALRGKYLKAYANGGYGDVKSSAVGPVVPAGAVELYRVEVAGAAKIGSTLQATAFKSSTSQVSANDVVSYQWQYSTTKSTSDSSFSDIVGATASTYAIGDTINGSASTGKYLRVKVTSDGSVVSTAKPSYSGTTQPVDPLGPITQAGEYTLSSVGLTSSGQGMQADVAITPAAKVTSGYTEMAVPSDAKLTYTWYVADSASGTYRALDEGYDHSNGVLLLDDALQGSYLKVTASALANAVTSLTYRVVGAGEFDLLRIILSPSSGDLLTGGSMAATVQAKNLTSTTYGDDVTSKVSFEWSVGDDREGPFVPLEGADASSLTIPDEAAGKYLKVTASSGPSSVEAVTSSKVVDGDSLEGIAKKLQQTPFKATPVYGVDSNVNDLVKAKLVELGYADVEVSTKTAEPRRSDGAATVGLSAADDGTNGAITYLFMDPSKASSPYISYTQLRQFDCVFELSRGEETYDFEPSYPVTIPWDEDLFEAFLDEESSSLDVEFVSGDTADAVTGDLALPTKLTDSTGSNKTWSSVTWDTSDASSIQIDGSSYAGYTGKVTRTASDRVVTLTATISAGTISSSGGPDTTITKTFDVTVKGDPDKVAAERAALAQKVASGFTYDALTYSETGVAVGQNPLDGDIQLPTPRTIGVDGKYYAVTYAASSDAVAVNGYRGNVYLSLPGSEPSAVDITLTVTDKSNAEISASKTLSLTVSPLSGKDITDELALMREAKAAYSDVLANGQLANAVTGDLRTFQKAYRDGQGTLAWAYDVASADAAGAGIVTVDLPGYDPMGTAGWRVFKSSNAGVVSHESLRVIQPQYNTKVTVSSCLSSEKYARYAERYADDPTWGATFSQLSAQNVTAAFTVAGTSGQVDPQVTATCSVIGADKSGNQKTWAAASPYTLDSGSTAADLSEAAFSQVGLAADFDPNGTYGWALNTITSPYDAGVTLGWDEATGRYWQLFINGVASTVGASGYTLQAGDSVIWYYSSYGDPAPTDQLAVTCEVIGSDASGLSQTWASAGSYEMDEGSTAADLSEAMFDRTGLAHEADNGSYGWFLDTITSPYDAGQTLGYDASTGTYWQLFINGEAATVGAGSYALQAGDSVVWCYSAYGESLPGRVAATCQIIGQDSQGNTQLWTSSDSYTMVAGSTAADLSEQLFARKGVIADYGRGTWGWYLNTITSPHDAGLTLGWDEATGKYWQLFVNGEAATVGAGSYALQAGDSVVWCYSVYGESLPDPDEVVVDPDAPRPSYDSSWPGYASGAAGGAVVVAPTPTESAALEWSYSFGKEGGASDPLVVNENIYLISGSMLMMIDGKTGELIRQTSIGSSIKYFCRPAYADGVIVVPTDNGSIAAFTADTLTCVWKTASLDEGDDYQALSSLTINNGRAYAGFTVPGGASKAGREGSLVCIDLKDGSVIWKTVARKVDTGQAEGYYWAGAASSGSDILIGNEAGKVALIDGATGKELSSVFIGTPCRAGIVVADTAPDGSGNGTYVAVSRDDGTLYKITRTGDELKIVASVTFAVSSTSTPAVVGGKAFVCGMDEQYYGTLSVIDLSTMKVEETVRGGQGASQSAPLVSVQGDGVYVYFTCNANPGGVYGYKVGDDAAYILYTPDSDKQQYCTASIVCDGDGNLYYTNDSGTLFALKRAPSYLVTFKTNDGSEIPASKTAQNKPMVAPVDPTRTGYSFAGWFVDESCMVLWEFSQPVEADMTLHAKWIENKGSDDGTPNDVGQQDGAGYSPAGTRAPGWGSVAPSQTPLARSDRDAGKDEKGNIATSEDSVDGKRAAKSQTTSEIAALSVDGSEVVNPWAVGGMALGVVGLAVATAYAIRSRRRGGEVS